MATADTPADESGSQCARDFVAKKLREADSPMAPAELAEEYGCTNGHVRNLLADLRDENVAERVAHGQYVAAEDAEDGQAADGLADLSAESEGNTETTTDDGSPDETAMETAEPTAGPAPSEGRDTGEMDTPDSGESMGIPLPVSANVVLGVAALFLLFMLWRRSQSSSTSADRPDREQSRQEDEDDDATEAAEVMLFE